MQNAPVNMEIEKPGKHLDDVQRVGGRGKFIRDCFDMFVFASPLDHAIDEARPIRAEYPGDPHNKMSPNPAKPGSSFSIRQGDRGRAYIEGAGRPSCLIQSAAR